MAATRPPGASRRYVDLAATLPKVQIGLQVSYADTVATDAAATGCMVVSQHRTPKQANYSAIQVTWGFFNQTNTSTPTEGTSYTVKAAIVVGSTIYPLYFRGSRTGTVYAGTTTKSDECHIVIPANTVYYVRYYCAWTTGQDYMTSATYTGDTTSGFFVNGATDQVDATGLPTGTGGIGVGSAPFLPLAILGKPDRRIPLDGYGPAVGGVALWGDSIMDASGDSPSLSNYRTIGFGPRACFDYGVGYVQLSLATYTVSGVNIVDEVRRRAVGLDGVSVVITNFGTNDIAAYNSATAPAVAAAAIQADMLAFGTIIQQMGKRFVPCTLIPKTAADGTPSVNANDTTTRVPALLLYNDWIRTNPFGQGYIDLMRVASKYAQTGNTADDNAFRTDLGTPTVDGTHPQSVIHSAMRDAVIAKLPEILV